MPAPRLCHPRSRSEPYGFKFEFGGAGASSGGQFAFGSYFSAERRLELHYRYSLGLVSYRFGELSIDHVSYMKAVLGSAGGNRYPGFSDQPISPFEGLNSTWNTLPLAFSSETKSDSLVILRNELEIKDPSPQLSP
jgi:hypothetical protein